MTNAEPNTDRISRVAPAKPARMFIASAALSHRWNSLPLPQLHPDSVFNLRCLKPILSIWLPSKAVLHFLWSPLTLVRFSQIPVQFQTTFLIHPVGNCAWDLSGEVDDQ